MNTGSGSCDHYTVLGVQFEFNLSCNTNRNQRIVDMAGKLILGDERGFLQQY